MARFNVLRYRKPSLKTALGVTKATRRLKTATGGILRRQALDAGTAQREAQAAAEGWLLLRPDEVLAVRASWEAVIPAYAHWGLRLLTGFLFIRCLLVLVQAHEVLTVRHRGQSRLVAGGDARGASRGKYPLELIGPKRAPRTPAYG